MKSILIHVSHSNINTNPQTIMSLINQDEYEQLIAQRRELENKINEARDKFGIMNVGGTHFKRERDICKRSNYNLVKILVEFIDNVAKLCSLINIIIIIDKNGYISEIRVSDNKNNGFENIRKIGTDNPFNFTHIRNGQDDDDELSQNGKGMKGGAVCISDRMDCYTNSNNNDKVKIICDFEKMASIEDRNESFNPKIFPLSDTEYRSEHKWDVGSTIVLSKINGKQIYGKTTEGELVSDLLNCLSETYTPIIKQFNLKININNITVEPEKDYFEEKECKPFITTYKLFKIQTEKNDEDDYDIIVEESIPFENLIEYHVFNRDTRKFNKLNNKDKIKYGLIQGSKNKIIYHNKFTNSNECIRVKSTTVIYHPDYQVDDRNLPRGRARLSLGGRRYGNWNKDGNNGTSNYIDTEIELSSKKIANEIGLTWNKQISNDQHNDLINALRLIITRTSSKLNSDTSSNANKKLYLIALENEIDVPTTKIPSGMRPEKKQKKTLILSDEDSGDDMDSDNNSTITSVSNEILTNNIILDICNEEDIKEPEVIQENVVEVIQENVEEVVEENVVENEDKKEIIPNLSTAQETTRKYLTISNGKEIVKMIQSNPQGINYDEDIKKILFEYMDHCSKFQIEIVLMILTFNQKCELLLNFINLRYRYSNENTERILCGSELYDISQKLQLLI